MSEKSSKDIVTAYFREIEGKATYAKCIACNAEVSKGNGLTNRVNHVKINHSNYSAKMDAQDLIDMSVSNKSILSHVICNDKAAHIYGWMSLIIDGNLPFYSVESPVYHGAVKYKKITYKTLIKYLRLAKEMVMENLKKELPDKFGLIIDGWTENGIHVLAVFANWSKSVATSSDNWTNKTRTDLLGMTQLTDPTNQTAPNQKETIQTMLGWYNKGFDNVIFLTADNTNVNPAIANLIGKPFIGCASHRLNLGVKKLLSNETVANNVKKVEMIMRKLDMSANVLSILKRYTNLNPVHKNETRWSSTFSMIERYVAIHEIVMDHYRDLRLDINILLTEEENEQLNSFYEELKEINEGTVVLQSQTMTVLRMRTLFDYLIEKYPDLEEYLAPDANIVHDEAFETGLVNMMKIKKNTPNATLTVAQANKIAIFKSMSSADTAMALQTARDIIGVDGPDVQLTIEERAERASKRQRNEAGLVHNEYFDVDWVQCTSNCVERLFSCARLVYTDYRKSMSPKSLELVLYLKSNRDKWSLNDMIPIFLAHADEDDDAEFIADY